MRHTYRTHGCENWVTTEKNETPKSITVNNLEIELFWLLNQYNTS